MLQRVGRARAHLEEAAAPMEGKAEEHSLLGVQLGQAQRCAPPVLRNRDGRCGINHHKEIVTSGGAAA